MPSRIDDKTMVPLGIVAALFTVGISITATGAFWVFRVDDRLSRIEQILKISSQANTASIVPDAEAAERK